MNIRQVLFQSTLLLMGVMLFIAFSASSVSMRSEWINETALLVLSNSQHIDVESKYKAARIRYLALRQTLDKHRCNYKSIFEDKQVQIAKVSCAQPEENE